MAELAKAYVQIIPSAKGMQGQLENLMGGDADAAGIVAGKKFSDKFSAAMKTGLKVGGVAAAAGVAAITKSAVTSYADYEQLVGGVETLFSNLDGTVSAAPKVLANAEKAYKNAGLSANRYMETVTSFSAALVASLEGDYDRAAEISDMAITDMADNANKMGSSMESLQNAYQGFAKQNYTMLDNLKLGYGGTKTEMERLLKDAQEISGIEYNIDSLSDVIEAIRVVQDEMGITGTTAAEAAGTISGSFAMTKGAWDNLLTGLASGNADVNQLMDDLISSAGTFADNAVPVIGQALESIGDAAPDLAGKLLEVIADNAPEIIEGAVDAAAGIATGVVQKGLESVFGEMPGFQESLEEGLQVDANAIAGPFFEMTDEMSSAMSGMASAASENASAFLDAGLASTAAYGEGAAQGMDGQESVFQAFARTLGEAFGFEMEAQRDPISEKAKAMADGAGDPLEALQDVSGSWGSHMGSNFASGLLGQVDAVRAAANALASAAAVPLEHTVPKEGPLSDDDVWGAHMVQNLIGGMERETPNLRRQVDATAQLVRDGMRFDAEVSRTGARGAQTAAGSDAMITELRALRSDIQNLRLSVGMDELAVSMNRKLGQTKQSTDRRALA